MKIRSMLVVSLMGLIAASSANAAVTFVTTTSVTGGRPLSAVQVGDVITINIRLSNPDLQNIAGVGGAAQGYNASIVRFDTGTIGEVSSFFCTNAAATACSNGLANAIDAFSPLVESEVTGVGKYVQFVNAITVTPRNGAGIKDPGIDGIIGGGDAEFRLQFTAIAEGTTTIDLGTTENATLGNVIVLAGGATEQGVNGTVNITVPEPGVAMAGLASLGTAIALAGVRRRLGA